MWSLQKQEGPRGLDKGVKIVLLATAFSTGSQQTHRLSLGMRIAFLILFSLPV